MKTKNALIYLTVAALFYAVMVIIPDEMRAPTSIAPVFKHGTMSCPRCGKTGAFPIHITEFKTDDPWGQSGCFVLCEQCWQELATPEARMPYYRGLYDYWVKIGFSKDIALSEWQTISNAVMMDTNKFIYGRAN